MVVAKLDRQLVIGALRATGSADEDVLYAKKEFLLAESYKMKPLGILPLIVGGAISLTIIGAVIGIPIILFGLAVGKTIKNNIAIANTSYVEYLQSLKSSTQQATPLHAV